MLRKIKINPLASETLGVRSLCAVVKTPDLTVLLDPSAASAKRFGLDPHPVEYQRLKYLTDQICEEASKSDVIVLTHYHYDHIKPPFTNYVYNWSSPRILSKIVTNKKIFTKDPSANINYNQRKRAKLLSKFFLDHSAEVFISDNQTIKMGKTHLKFSAPMPHGYENTPLGFVVSCKIEYENESVLFASDVQGPTSSIVRNYILKEHPSSLILSGPPLYLRGKKLDDEMIQRAKENLSLIAHKVPLILIDHHLCRDKDYQKWLNPIRTNLPPRHKISTFSGYLGNPEVLFEARRKDLYRKNPPNQQFKIWLNLPRKQRNLIQPPLS